MCVCVKEKDKRGFGLKSIYDRTEENFGEQLINLAKQNDVDEFLI